MASHQYMFKKFSASSDLSFNFWALFLLHLLHADNSEYGLMALVCRYGLLPWILGFQSRLHLYNVCSSTYSLFVLFSANIDFFPYRDCVCVAMGNEKANSYWEAELPPNYDRVGIENFIRAK